MEVIAYQNLPLNQKVPTRLIECSHCHSILKISKNDVKTNHDKYGEWFSVLCPCCSKEYAIPGVVVQTLID